MVYITFKFSSELEQIAATKKWKDRSMSALILIPQIIFEQNLEKILLVRKQSHTYNFTLRQLFYISDTRVLRLIFM